MSTAFADNVFQSTLLNEKVCFTIEISFKFVSECPIDKKPSLVQIMA